jgi:hypothetical protein
MSQKKLFYQKLFLILMKSVKDNLDKKSVKLLMRSCIPEMEITNYKNP